MSPICRLCVFLWAIHLFTKFEKIIFGEFREVPINIISTFLLETNLTFPVRAGDDNNVWRRWESPTTNSSERFVLVSYEFCHMDSQNHQGRIIFRLNIAFSQIFIKSRVATDCNKQNIELTLSNRLLIHVDKDSIWMSLIFGPHGASAFSKDHEEYH